MPHCNKCGTAIAEAVSFCPNCGQATGVAAPAGAARTQSGLAENVAGLLCYVLGWLTGLVFFLIDKRPFVRFHAAQSIVVFGGLNVLRIVLGVVFGFGWFLGGWEGFAGIGTGVVLSLVLSLLTLVLWIVCMIKAFQGQRFRVPVAADLAEQLAGK